MADPEHGTRDGRPQDPPPAQARSRATLLEHARCFGCQYNLVGRTLDEPCPECGMDAAASWPADTLANAHPILIGQLVRELWWLLAICLIAMTSSISLSLGAVIDVFSTPGTRANHLGFALLVVGLAGWLAVYPPALMPAVTRLMKHANSMHSPGAWPRWHAQASGAIVAVGFLGLLLIAPIAIAIAQRAGLVVALGCCWVIAIGAAVHGFAAWAYAGSIRRRIRGRPPRRSLEFGFMPLILGVACGTLFAVTGWLGGDLGLLGVFLVTTVGFSLVVYRLSRSLIELRATKH